MFAELIQLSCGVIMAKTLLHRVEKQQPVIRRTSPLVLAFLHGSIVHASSLSKLRGLDHILKYVWTFVCGEWWDLHVERFYDALHNSLVLPELTQPWVPVFANGEPGMYYPKERQQCAGCPVAVIAKSIEFPDNTHVPEGVCHGQESPDLYINMMPFLLNDKTSLPDYCAQYWPLIEHCLQIVFVRQGQVGYLTIDERPVVSGHSQRRSGLHVESPGVMPLIQHDGSVTVKSGCDIALRDNVYIPGAEHHWGGGLMMRDEHVEGGIFMASNVANTTAVWNCQIHDEDGDFIGPHGDIERFRELLGPCARTLEAGELIWMTDRTPHESLPVPLQPDGSPVRRQYFRLVVGTVTAWFADHSTLNPLGLVIPKDVRVVRGNKHELYPTAGHSWHCGTAQQLHAAREFRAFRTTLCEYGLGHTANYFRRYGILSIDDLLRHWKQCEDDRIEPWERWVGRHGKPAMPLSDIPCTGYYEESQLEELIGNILVERSRTAVVQQIRAGVKQYT